MHGVNFKAEFDERRTQNRSRMHHQHMLQAERGEFAGGRFFIDRVDRL